MAMPEMPMPRTDVAELIRNVNGTNNAVEDQYLRARQAADTAIRSDQTAGEAKAVARLPRSRTRPFRPSGPGGARPCRGRLAWPRARSPSTAWPAISRPRPSTGARTAP